MKAARFAPKACPFDAARREAKRATGEWPRICRWCGKELAGRRTGWCSDACVSEYLVRRSGPALRRAVHMRDKGVCALCRLDCDALKAQIRALKFGGENIVRWDAGRSEQFKAEIARLKAAGFDDPECSSLWEADHIVPVVAGGGGCGMDNIRTLCVPCHKRETAGLARRRAEERARAAGRPEQPGLPFDSQDAAVAGTVPAAAASLPSRA